jgi:hypothetical protein
MRSSIGSSAYSQEVRGIFNWADSEPKPVCRKERKGSMMAKEHWTNKWVLMLMIGIAIQVVVYPTVWILELFSHEYFLDVFVISIASLTIQIGGFYVIMTKTRGEHPDIYGQGRPFQHKLREEDIEVASRKPTFD